LLVCIAQGIQGGRPSGLAKFKTGSPCSRNKTPA
jgi:hypothetical protein